MDVNALVTDMADMLRRLVGEHIELTTAPGAEMPNITVGRGQLEQVVMNLVVNACVAPGRGDVLLAGDEAAVRRLARIILERAGYTVVEAANPDEANTIAESASAIDLLLTDVIMPGGTGPDLFRRFSPSRPGMRVLFMSGYAERELFDRETIGRTDAFIAKPFSAATLVDKVRHILDR